MAFPPGKGLDALEVGARYVIGLLGTRNVFTAEGDDLRVRPYTENRGSQVWTCTRDRNNQFSFTNVETGKFLGRDVWQHLVCSATVQREWECLTLTSLTGGGYRLSVLIDDRLCPASAAHDSGGDYMKVVAESSTRIGLHLTEQSPFDNFEWVIPDRLARSSSPFYVNRDSDQNMNSAAIRYLVNNHITNVISLNQIRLSNSQVDELSRNGITYTHIPVRDFHPPTLDQLEQAYNQFNEHSGTTLVYCGFGHGRTGTVISAIQLYMGRSLTRRQYKSLNHVEKPEQEDVLDELKRKLGRYFARNFYLHTDHRDRTDL